MLGVLAGCDEPPDLTAIYRVVTDLATDLGLEAEITTGSAEPPVGARHGRVNGRAARHGARQPAAAGRGRRRRGRIAASGANIDRITRLASDPVTCVELDVSGADPGSLRTRSPRWPPTAAWTWRCSAPAFTGGRCG